MNLLEALGQAIRIPELRRKLLFTLGLLAAFRILAAIAIPGTNPKALADLFSSNTLLGLPLAAGQSAITYDAALRLS